MCFIIIVINPLWVEYFLGNMKSLCNILSYLNTGMAHVVELIPHTLSIAHGAEGMAMQGTGSSSRVNDLKQK